MHKEIETSLDRQLAHMSEPEQVLMFDINHRLLGLFGSMAGAARAIGCSRQSVYNAAVGAQIACQGFYFRTYDKNFIIDSTDFGKLTMEEYDESCGITGRRSFEIGKMKIKGKTYIYGETKVENTERRKMAVKNRRHQEYLRRKERKMLNES